MVHTILVVEDSRPIRRMVVAAITERTTFQVVEAGSLAEVREILAGGTNGFFLALLDLVLPDAVRGEVVDVVREAGIASVVFTTELNEDIRRSVMRRGAIDYVIKRDSGAVSQVVQLIERLHRNRSVWVLAVDDSAAMRAYYERLLRNYFFQTLVAGSGEEALRLLDSHAEVSLVICDYVMQDMDGFRLVEEIRRRRSRTETAIIGCTGRDDAVVAARFLKEGANDVLVKPFWNEEFYQRVLQNVETVEQVRRLQDLNQTKNRFVGIAAHDLRSPLGVMVGLTDLLVGGYEGSLTAEQTELIRTIRRSAEGMLALVNNLLDVTSIESGSLRLHREELNLADLVREQVRLMSPTAERKGIVVQIAADESVTAICDRRAMQQVLTNLLSNAVKYSYKDSVVHITVQREGASGIIRVRDTGLGIATEEQALLFRPFQSLSSAPTAGESSHGLGLAIVKLMVEAHGGTVSVVSAPGAGSTFSVTLPSPTTAA